ncbi:MAG: YfcC family protein [Bacteroidetes bacterium]|nr:MAG: YfcC family protein [Bacteroidota bacterium]
MLKKVPHTYVIVFAILIIAGIATWFIPGGEYERTTKIVDGVSRTVIIDGSFHQVESQPQTWEIFSAFFNGFEKQAGIIVFILMIGGAFWIMNQSRAIDVGIYSFLGFTKKIEHWRALKFVGVDNVILILIMTMFSAFGAIFGMSEETIAFIIIIVPLAISMGYDSITGVAIVFVAAGLGFAGAILNPFTIGIAQGLSDLQLFSGMGYRMVSWVVINTVGFTFILIYANKIKKNPEKSLTYKIDDYWRQRNSTDVEDVEYFTPQAAWIVYAITLIVLILFSFDFSLLHNMHISNISNISMNITEMKIGNSSYHMPALPISAGLFAILGLFSLRKSVHFFILTLLLFTIIFLIVGVMGYNWYIMEIATLFFVMGLLSGISMSYSADNIVKHFIDGVKDITSAALVVGLAGGIILILQEGKVIDTILNSLSSSMEGMGKVGSVEMMYVIQNVINIIIPSGSAKAALTMPIMAPFSDVIGISRQATVMAFQFGDGFTNMITPTSGVLIGVLGVARIPYDIWVKWIWKLILALLIVGALLLIPTVLMTLEGF